MARRGAGLARHRTGQARPGAPETVAGDDVDAWCRVAAEAMHLQRDLVGHEGRLEQAGPRHLHPRDAAAYVRFRTDSLLALPEADPRRMDPEVAARLDDLLPTVERWGAELDALGVAENLVHNDLHAGNVFATASGMRFFDFGDALLTHPLAALFIPVNLLLHRFGGRPGDPRLRRSCVAPCPAALHLARLARAESWLRVVATMTAAERAEYGDAGTWWLGALGDPTPLS